MANVAELGQKVKGKYPGQYDDLPDDEVGRRLKAKFPGAYDDFSDDAPKAQPQAQPPAPAAPQSESLMSRAGKIAGSVIPSLFSGPTPGSKYGPVTNAVIGAGKGALHTAQNLSDMASVAFPGGGVHVRVPGDDAKLAPTNTPQKVGYGLEQAAEYMIPAGVEAQGVKALDAAAQGMKAAPVVRTLGRGAISALSAGGVAGVQTKDPGQAAKAALTAGGTAGALNAIKEAAPAVGRATAAVLGKTTGAGSNPIQQAVKNPSPALVEQMRNPDESEVVGSLKDALQNLKDSRASAYREQLAKLPNQPVIDPTPIKEALAKKLEDFRVGTTAPVPAMKIGSEVIPPEMAAKLTPRGNIPMAPGKLDFSGSPMSKPGQKDITEVTNLVQKWKDWTPLGADALKRRIDDMYSESKQARAFIAAMKKEVGNNIVAQVPEYAQMTGDYAKASELLDHLADLSLTSKNPGTAIRKITTTLNQNNEYRKGLVDALQQYSGTDLNGQVAGLALSKLAPRGIMGPASGAGLVLGIVTGAIDPTRVAALALTSPRIMGEVAVALGKVRPLLSKAGTAAQTVAPGLAAYGVMPPPQAQPRQVMPPPGQ